jgi:hypothetical protein
MIETTRHFIKIATVLAAVGVLSLTAAYLLGISICPIYNIVGIPCPSCGMTRAWTSALRGDVKTALFYHPMFWSVAGLPIIEIKDRRVNRIAVIILIIFIAVWLVRMVLLFPDVEPMVINERALILRVLGFFR